MNKKTVLTSLTAAALAGVFLTGANVSENVKAAVKPNGETAKAKTAEENAQDNVNSAQKEVDNAQQNVSSAKVNLNSAQSNAEGSDAAYSAQKAKTDIAQKNEADKKAALDKATDAQKQAQQLVNDSKDPAKVKQANDDVTAKSSALDTAKKEQTAADKNVSDQDAQVKQAQNQVNDLTKTRDDKQKAKTAADQQVKNAEDALRGTGVAEAEKLYKNNKDRETTILTNLSKRSENKSQLEKQKNELENQLPDATKNRQIANSELQKYEQQWENAKAKSAQISSQFSSKQKEIQDLNQKLKELTETSKNKITIPDVNKYKTALLDYFNNINQLVPLTAEDIAYMNEARAQNKYISSEEDKKEKVDLDHMTDDQIKDLSLFAANLTTQLRKQFGWKADIVTNGSINFGKEVAQGYLADYKTYPVWHDDKRLDEAKKNQELKSCGEAMGPNQTSFYSKIVTMDELKGNIYKLLNSMIFTNGGIDNPNESISRYELGHAALLLGAHENGKTSIQSIDYIESADQRSQLDLINEQKKLEDAMSSEGVQLTLGDKDQLDKEAAQLQKEIDEAKQGDISLVVTNYGYQPEYGNYAVGYHFLRSIPKKDSHYDLTVIPSYAEQIKQIQAQIKAKSNELIGLQQQVKALNDYENEIHVKFLIPAQTKASEATNKVTNLQNQLQLINPQINKLNEEISTLHIQLKDVQNAINQDGDRLSILTADNKTKTANLEKAQNNQKQAQSALTEAESNLDKATNALNTAKDQLESLQNIAQTKATAVKQAQSELDAANSYIQELNNASQALTKANQAKDKAQSDYDAAKKVADEAQAQLNKLESEKTTADGQVVAAQTKYNEAVASLKAAEDKLASAKSSLEKIKQSESLINTVNEPETQSDKSTTEIKGNTNDLNKSDASSLIDNTSEYKNIRLTHNAYVYTKELKVVKNKTHKNIMLKKGHYVKAWNKGKIVTIKGKKFYQIGKNRFVKVANTINKRAEKNYVLATVKGRKNHKVRVYLANGKFAKKYVLAKKTYKLAEKKTIKDNTYYRIYGKKLWVRASNIELKK